jgi:asparagine synthase (glutamine-hydrolysing)
MIAAVVHPRGDDEARAVLARMSRDFTDVRVRSGALVARTEGGAKRSRLEGDLDLEQANARSDVGALVALSSTRDGGVILARGSFGGRPLYYARTSEGGWIACSEVEPILAALGTRLPIDVDRIASHVAAATHPEASATSFAGLSRVEPCTAVELTPGRSRSAVRPSPERSPLDAPLQEIAEEMWRRFALSVKRTVGDARRVAVMVGGGVDSSGLLAAAVALLRGASGGEAFALALDFDADCTDRPFLADLARHLDIVPVRLAPREAGPWFGKTLVLDAQPYILCIGPMEQLVFRRARELGAEVLLSGYLADEILAGDPRVLSLEAPLAAISAAVALQLPWETTARQRVTDFVVRPLLKPFVPHALLARSAARIHAKDFPWAGPRLVEVLARAREHAATLRAPRTPRERFDRFARDPRYMDFADWRGQVESTTGIVREDPYASEDLVDLISRAPPAALFHDGLHRGLYREALRGKVPESIRRRITKAWFEPAFAETAEAGGGLRSLGDLWEPSALGDLDIVDSRAFRRSIEPLLRDPLAPEAGDLWTVGTQSVACEAFCRRFR